MVRADRLIHGLFILAAVGLLLVTAGPRRAEAQTLTLGEQVRVTVRESGETRQVTGWLHALTPDTLTVRLTWRETWSVARADVARLEQRRNNVSIGRTAGIGCLVGAGVLGGLGLASRDADSPGMQQALAGVGLVAGCAIGGAAGFVGGVISRGSWREVALPPPTGAGGAE